MGSIKPRLYDSGMEHGKQITGSFCNFDYEVTKEDFTLESGMSSILHEH